MPSLLIILRSLNRRDTRGLKQVLDPAMTARSQIPARMAATASSKARRLELQAVSVWTKGPRKSKKDATLCTQTLGTLGSLMGSSKSPFASWKHAPQ